MHGPGKYLAALAAAKTFHILIGILIGAAVLMGLAAQDARAQTRCVRPPVTDTDPLSPARRSYQACVDARREADSAREENDSTRNVGLTIGYALIGIGAAVWINSELSDDGKAASLSFRPIAFDRTLGFDIAFRPSFIPGSLGFRMIREEKAPARMSVRYAIPF